jgi:hypothetical protein
VWGEAKKSTGKQCQPELADVNYRKKCRRNYRNVIKLACVFYDSPVEGQTTINDKKINPKVTKSLLLNGVSFPHQLVERTIPSIPHPLPTISFLFFYIFTDLPISGMRSG